MNNGSARKSRPPPQHPSPAPPPKHQALSQEEDFVDEDVFLDENLLDEDALILRDIEERQALASRISKWARPPLSQDYLSQSKSIGESNFVVILLPGMLHSMVLILTACVSFCFFVFGVSVFQQLEIDYVIGESHKELLPNLSGPAAILRIFGVTREGLCSSKKLKFICYSNEQFCPEENGNH